MDNNTVDGAVMMSSSACGYAIDFGDVFQKKNSSSSRAALMTSSHIGNNENVPPANSRHAESTFHPPRVGGTKQWQLPHYNSIEENAVYLNRQLELQQYGVHDAFTSLVFRASSQDDDADMRRIMDCMHWLLHSRREEMRKSDEMAEQFIRYEKEIHRKNNQIQTLTAQLEAERKTCSDLENQLTAKDAAYTKERLQFKEEKRALERKCIQLTHVDTNYKAQLRKSEVSYERLQKQYNAYLNKASTDKRGMALGKELNGKQTCHQIRNSTSNQSKTSGEHNIINTMIRSYESQHLTLLQENDSLRAQLAQFYAELKQAMAEYRAAAKWFLHRHGNDNQQWDDQLQLPVVDESKLVHAFTMPLRNGPENVLNVLEDHVSMLRSKIACLMDATQDRERSALEARLQEAYQVAAHEKDPRSARLDLSGLEDMLEEVALERQEIAIKAQHMETEREQYMVQAERLDKDRLEFEFERHAMVTRGANQADMFAEGGKKRLRMDLTPTQNTRRQESDQSPFGSTSGGSGLPLPPTPATARLLERIGILHDDQMMSPIAAPRG
ncbi:hypothetical protein, variant [Aphanomyces invadans]|uniref:Uncharacterized protein n=1 Tax=Aphanomyces invadans TaxID=157072 RepID=A0A024UGC8_9STRA|nr:hypothetical protein, variant [Aphanomyces invadans]ETW04703.1 hypothetical protein, variant [Aphanomyces invadans]|eukprot:XP_008866140.1 hypothetical protein, variant [Aphanomyces invadans]